MEYLMATKVKENMSPVVSRKRRITVPEEGKPRMKAASLYHRELPQAISLQQRNTAAACKSF
jgi:hypothetical protein